MIAGRFPAGRFVVGHDRSMIFSSRSVAFSAMVCDECFHGDSSLRLVRVDGGGADEKGEGRCAEKDFFGCFHVFLLCVMKDSLNADNSTDGGGRQPFRPPTVCIGLYRRLFRSGRHFTLAGAGRRVAGLCDNVASMPLYAVREPFHEGRLAVGDGHEIAFAEYGCPEGGAGGLFAWGAGGRGSQPSMSAFFNPERYRVVLFDQRGVR